MALHLRRSLYKVYYEKQQTTYKTYVFAGTL
jgi:hypothetical protein